MIEFLEPFAVPAIVSVITTIGVVWAASVSRPTIRRDDADTAKAISDAFRPVVEMLNHQLASSKAIIAALETEVARLQLIVNDFALALTTVKETMRQNGMADKIPPDPPGLVPVNLLMRGGVAGYSADDQRRAATALVRRRKP